ncbi:hypothetical protein QOT17_021227 [Balamuthia mandrillaris]
MKRFVDLKALPSEFGQLHALTNCGLSNNKLSSLPREFGQLRALGYCYLNNSRLNSLPREFGQLTALTACCFFTNLKALPSEFGQLTARSYCDLNDLFVEVEDEWDQQEEEAEQARHIDEEPLGRGKKSVVGAAVLQPELSFLPVPLPVLAPFGCLLDPWDQ